LTHERILEMPISLEGCWSYWPSAHPASKAPNYFSPNSQARSCDPVHAEGNRLLDASCASISELIPNGSPCAFFKYPSHWLSLPCSSHCRREGFRSIGSDYGGGGPGETPSNGSTDREREYSWWFFHCDAQFWSQADRNSLHGAKEPIAVEEEFMNESKIARKRSPLEEFVFLGRRSVIRIVIRFRREVDSDSRAFQSIAEATRQWRREARSNSGASIETKARR
jgi:hypothetical protein